MTILGGDDLRVELGEGEFELLLRGDEPCGLRVEGTGFDEFKDFGVYVLFLNKKIRPKPAQSKSETYLGRVPLSH